jgi:hypothetical protein
MYYGTLLGTIACLALFIITLIDVTTSSRSSGDTLKNNNIQLFIYGTSFLDYIGFLLGAIYFVSGSYPVENTNISNSMNSIGHTAYSMGHSAGPLAMSPYHDHRKSPEFDTISDHSILISDNDI